jgi:hypothetical protein
MIVFQFNSIQFKVNPSISKQSLMVTRPNMRKTHEKEPTDILYQKKKVGKVYKLQ